MSFSNDAETKTMQFWFRTGTPTKPSALYVALATAAVLDTNTGSTFTEANYGSYARVQRDPLDANWSSASAGTVTNAAAITFPKATSGSSTVTYVVIVDASSGGNVVAWCSLDVSKAITTGDTPQFEASSLTFTLD
jgi:hypothetical protein